VQTEPYDTGAGAPCVQKNVSYQTSVKESKNAGETMKSQTTALSCILPYQQELLPTDSEALHALACGSVVNVLQSSNAEPASP
jgi:hypothetical protein